MCIVRIVCIVSNVSLYIVQDKFEYINLLSYVVQLFVILKLAIVNVYMGCIREEVGFIFLLFFREFGSKGVIKHVLSVIVLSMYVSVLRAVGGMGCMSKMSAIVSQSFADILRNFRANMEKNSWRKRYEEGDDSEVELLILNAGYFELYCIVVFFGIFV